MTKCKLCNRTNIQSKKLKLCSIHYARWYRKRNRDKIRPVSHANYLKNREDRLKKVKAWHKRNMKRKYKRELEYYHKNKLKFQIRNKTRHHFNHLKKECEICHSIENLEFHHEEPYRFDVFNILCKRCHLDLENEKKNIKFYYEKDAISNKEVKNGN